MLQSEPVVATHLLMESIILIYMVSLSCRTSRSEAVVATSPTHGVHYSNIHGIPVMQNITF